MRSDENGRSCRWTQLKWMISVNNVSDWWKWMVNVIDVNSSNSNGVNKSFLHIQIRQAKFSKQTTWDSNCVTRVIDCTVCVIVAVSACYSWDSDHHMKALTNIAALFSKNRRSVEHFLRASYQSIWWFTSVSAIAANLTIQLLNPSYNHISFA